MDISTFSKILYATGYVDTVISDSTFNRVGNSFCKQLYCFRNLNKLNKIN